MGTVISFLKELSERNRQQGDTAQALLDEGKKLHGLMGRRDFKNLNLNGFTFLGQPITELFLQYNEVAIKLKNGDSLSLDQAMNKIFGQILSKLEQVDFNSIDQTIKELDHENTQLMSDYMNLLHRLEAYQGFAIVVETFIREMPWYVQKAMKKNVYYGDLIGALQEVRPDFVPEKFS